MPWSRVAGWLCGLVLFVVGCPRNKTEIREELASSVTGKLSWAPCRYKAFDPTVAGPLAPVAKSTYPDVQFNVYGEVSRDAVIEPWPFSPWVVRTPPSVKSSFILIKFYGTYPDEVFALIRERPTPPDIYHRTFVHQRGRWSEVVGHHCVARLGSACVDTLSERFPRNVDYPTELRVDGKLVPITGVEECERAKIRTFEDGSSGHKLFFRQYGDGLILLVGCRNGGAPLGLRLSMNPKGEPEAELFRMPAARRTSPIYHRTFLSTHLKSEEIYSLLEGTLRRRVLGVWVVVAKGVRDVAVSQGGGAFVVKDDGSLSHITTSGGVTNLTAPGVLADSQKSTNLYTDGEDGLYVDSWDEPLSGTSERSSLEFAHAPGF